MRSLKTSTVICLGLVTALLTTSCATKHINASVYPNTDFAPSDVTLEYVKVHQKEIPDQMIEDLAKCKQAAEVTEALNEETDVTSFDFGPTWAWVAATVGAAWLGIKTFFGGIFSWLLP